MYNDELNKRLDNVEVEINKLNVLSTPIGVYTQRMNTFIREIDIELKSIYNLVKRLKDIQKEKYTDRFVDNLDKELIGVLNQIREINKKYSKIYSDKRIKLLESKRLNKK